MIWDATGSEGAPDHASATRTHPGADPAHPADPTDDLPSGWSTAAGVTVSFGWVSVGTLLDQPFAPWTGTPLALVGSGAGNFPVWSGQPILLQDSNGSASPPPRGHPGTRP